MQVAIFVASSNQDAFTTSGGGYIAQVSSDSDALQESKSSKDNTGDIQPVSEVTDSQRTGNWL